MMNIPPVVITNDLEPMRKDAKEYLDLLIQSKILHFSPEAAAIIVVWKILIGGYLKVQENINKFCFKYAKKLST